MVNVGWSRDTKPAGGEIIIELGTNKGHKMIMIMIMIKIFFEVNSLNGHPYGLCYCADS